MRGQHRQAGGASGEVGLQVERFRLEQSAGEQPAEVAVALFGFDQADGSLTAAGAGDLRPDDGGDALLAAGLQKRPQPVEIVGVGQRQAVIAQLPRRTAQPPGRGRAPHEGVVGADDEGDHGAILDT